MAKSNLTKNTILLSIGTILNKGLMFIMVPFFSKWLTTGDYGTFDLLTTYVTILIPILTLSTGEAVFRYSIDEEDEIGKSKYITNGLVIVLIGLLIFLFGMVIVYNVTKWTLTIPFIILAVNEIFNKYLQSYLRAIRKLNIYSLSSTLSTVVIAISVTVLIRIFDKGLEGMVYGYALGYFFANAVIILVTRYWRYLCKDISGQGMLELIKYSYSLIPNSISWWVMNVSDRLIIKSFLGVSYNGIYAIACKIPSLCTAIFGVFSISWQESASDVVNSNERNKYFNNVYNKMLRILLPLCAGIMSVNFILFDFIFDLKYSIARYYVPILIAATVFTSISQFYGGIQISLKQPQENGKSTVVGAIVNIIVNLFLIKLAGLYAAAISTLIAFIVVTYLRKNKLKSLIKIKLDKDISCYIIFYLYLFILNYLKTNIIINIINILFAGIIFIFANKELILKVVKKL